MDRKQQLAAALILMVAALLRICQLGSNPPGLFRDEAEKGWTAYELWHTARHGEFLPTGFTITRPFPFFVEAGGVETSAIYQYLSAPIVGLFGLDVETTRMAAALCGTVTVLLVFFLAQWFSKQDDNPANGGVAVGLAAMAFTALSPTHVLFSRWAQQGITVPMWTTAGLLALLAASSAVEKNRRALSAVGGLLMGLAFYSYDPARLVVPVILLGLAWELWRDPKHLVKIYWPGALLFLAIAVPTFIYAITGGSARFSRVSVFAERSAGAGVLLFLENYVRHFDPRFLFFTGDNNPRHGLPLAGLMAWGEFLFFLPGLWSIRKLNAPGSRLLLVWLLAAPLAASLTAEGIPHALRSILFLPAVHLISARGFGGWIRLAGERRAVPLLITERLVALGLLVYSLFHLLPQRGAPWQQGIIEALEVLDRERHDGPRVLSAEVPYAHYYVLFAEHPDVEEFHELGMEGTTTTMILPPGAPMPRAALVARPAYGTARPVFEKIVPGPLDIVSPEGEVLFTIREGWGQ